MATLVEYQPRRVSVLELLALADLDRLPTLPPEITALGLGPRKREPSPTELARYEWYTVERERRVTGVMGLRIVFDLHDNCDVISVEHLAGSARGVNALIDYALALSVALKYPVVGAIDFGNVKMAKYLARKNFRLARLAFRGPL